RNIFERRGELALLRAVGFRRATLAWLVMLENAALLIAGLGIGAIAAAVALVPHLRGGAQASIPWQSMAAMLGTVLLVGLAVGTIAVRSVLAVPVLDALRHE
ncbi:MAG TPA: ABC transporter permease, partial [Pirellulales bacterium]|nr:ABC transporter permease [Pirellulales bacterium]